jgi:hypothetical protein
MKAVRDADDSGEGLQHLKDRKNDNAQGQDGEGASKDAGGDSVKEAELQLRPVQDPNVGKYVDLQG